MSSDMVDTSANKPENAPSVILVVEDYAPNILVTSTLLELAGYKYDTAQNCADALTKLSNNKYSLILLDIQMPDMDGFEVARKIRENKNIKDIPIIAMTAYALSGVREKCLKAGMNDYIAKPFDPNVLNHKIGRLIF